MPRYSSPLLGGSLLLALAAAFPVAAAQPDIDLPRDREDRAAVLFRMQQDRQGMTAADLPAADAPRAPDDGWGSPPPPPSGNRFHRFLQGAVAQAQGLSYQEAYRILKDSLIKAREVAPLPAGLDAAMQGLVTAGVESKGYEDKRQVLLDGIEFLIQNTGALNQEGPQAFRPLMQMAHGIGFGKSYQNAYFARKHILLTVRERNSLMGPTERAFVNALIKAGEEVKGYDDKRTALTQGLEGYLEGPPEPAIRAYFSAIARIGTGLSYQNAYFSRKHMLLALRDEPGALPTALFEVSVRGAVKAGEEIKGYEDKMKVLERAGEYLTRISPRSDWRDYYRLALEASAGLSYQNSYFVKKHLLLTLLQSGHVDQFDRLSLEQAVKNGENARGYDDKSRVLQTALEAML